MKRALLIGIDRYDTFWTLAGCVNDIDAIEPLLSRHDDGSVNFSCKKRTDATGGTRRDALLRDVDLLLGGSDEVALMYFAGHGVAREHDVVLVTADGTSATPGLALSEILGKVADSAIREVVLILDCCFAGAGGGVPQLGTDQAVLRSGLTILAASRGDQPATETPRERGLFSTFIEGALRGGAADVLGRVTVGGLYSYIDESFGPWDQRPTFKANVDRLHELRECRPSVPLADLRQIDVLFHTPDELFRLDPSYEPTAEPRYPEHEVTFALLQRLRSAKLVEPVSTEHMYFAAMESKPCRLTPLGKHYWHMADQARF